MKLWCVIEDKIVRSIWTDEASADDEVARLKLDKPDSDFDIEAVPANQPIPVECQLALL